MQLFQAAALRHEVFVDENYWIEIAMPSSKLLLSYNIPPERHEPYMRFMINQFIPALHTVGLMNIGVWQTVFGDYPIRLLVLLRTP